MKLIIFGATGRVGAQLVDQALSQGHSVTAFVRDPQKLKHVNERNLNIVIGNVMTPADVDSAIERQDAVMVALGSGRKGVIRSEGTHNIIKAMECKGVKRLICQTTLGTGDSRENLNFVWKHIMFGWLLKEAYEDHQKQEAYIMQSALQWTIVRPGAFTEGPATGKYRHGFSPKDKNTKLKISIADVAHFMLSQLQSNQYVNKTPGLSY
jgi:putative NADH-flavin reductase